jgi:hypothetical protein
MTQQIEDTVRFRDEEWALAEVEGELDFSPEEHGLSPTTPHTACWRGYTCEYEVGERLTLARLHVHQKEQPELFGVKPRRVREDYATWNVYALERPIDFSGAILLGRGHTGEQLTPGAYCYDRVLELVLESGRLMRDADVTEEAQRLKALWTERSWKKAPIPPPEDEESFARWRAEMRVRSSFFEFRRELRRR